MHVEVLPIEHKYKGFDRFCHVSFNWNLNPFENYQDTNSCGSRV